MKMTVRKITLTQEQAKAVELMLEKYDEDISHCIDEHSRIYNDKDTGFDPEFKALNELPPSDLSRALLVGYDVKSIAKVGDYAEVVWGRGTITRKVLEVAGDRVVVSLDGSMMTGATPIRILSDEETKEHKRREWWSKHNRDVWDIREGDILTNKHNETFIVDDNKCTVINLFTFSQFTLTHKINKEDEYKVMYFAEDRKDIKQ